MGDTRDHKTYICISPFPPDLRKTNDPNINSDLYNKPGDIFSYKMYVIALIVPLFSETVPCVSMPAV